MNLWEVFHATRQNFRKPRPRAAWNRVVSGDLPGVYAATDKEALFPYLQNSWRQGDTPYLWRGEVNPRNPLDLQQPIDQFDIGRRMGLSPDEIGDLLSRPTTRAMWVEDPTSQRNVAALLSLLEGAGAKRAGLLPPSGTLNPASMDLRTTLARDAGYRALRRALYERGNDVILSRGHGVMGSRLRTGGVGDPLTVIDPTGRNIKWTHRAERPNLGGNINWTRMLPAILAASGAAAAASDASASVPRTAFNASPESIAKTPMVPGLEVTAPQMEPAEALNRSLYPTGGKGDFVKGALAANISIPTAKDAKDLLTQILGTAFGIPEAGDANKAGLDSLQSLPRVLGEMVQTPYGLGSLVGMLTPWGLQRLGRIIPLSRPFRRWTMKALELPKQEFLREAAGLEPQLIAALEAGLTTPAIKYAPQLGGIHPTGAIIGDFLRTPEIRQTLENVLGTDVFRLSGNTNFGGVAIDTRYFPQYPHGVYVKPDRTTTRSIPRTRLFGAPWSSVSGPYRAGKIALPDNSALATLLHEAAHMRQLNELPYSYENYTQMFEPNITHDLRLGEVGAQKFEHVLAPFEHLNQSLLQTRLGLDIPPASFHDLVNTKGVVRWTRR